MTPDPIRAKQMTERLEKLAMFLHGHICSHNFAWDECKENGLALTESCGTTMGYLGSCYRAAHYIMGTFHFITKQEASERVAAVVEDGFEELILKFQVQTFGDIASRQKRAFNPQESADLLRTFKEELSELNPTEILAQLKERVRVAALEEAAKVACEYCQQASQPYQHLVGGLNWKGRHQAWSHDVKEGEQVIVHRCHAQAIRALMDSGKEGK